MCFAIVFYPFKQITYTWLDSGSIRLGNFYDFGLLLKTIHFSSRRQLVFLSQIFLSLWCSKREKKKNHLSPFLFDDSFHCTSKFFYLLLCSYILDTHMTPYISYDSVGFVIHISNWILCSNISSKNCYIVLRFCIIQVSSHYKQSILHFRIGITFFTSYLLKWTHL